MKKFIGYNIKVHEMQNLTDDRFPFFTPSRSAPKIGLKPIFFENFSKESY